MMTTRREFIKAATGFAAVSVAGSHFGGRAFATEPARGGHLTAAMVLEPASLDPIFGNASGADRRFYNLFAENLVLQDSKGELQPQLAESWEIAPDGMSILFKLRAGVTFQDGTPFDGDAVKFNFDRVVDPEVKARARQLMNDYDSTEVIDPLTIRVHLKRPSGPFLALIANEPGSIVSPTAVAERGPDFARKPIGTGPFIVENWAAGKVDARRNDAYWGGAPLLDTVSVRTISNTAVKLVELKSGSVHLGDIVQVKDIPDIEADPSLVLQDVTQVITSYVSFNNAAAPFKDNLALRKAVAYGINREALEKAISRGEGGVMAGLEPPQSPAYSEKIVGHSYDPEAAKAAYAESGHSGPLTLVVIQRDPDTQIAQIIQSMLGQVGIEIRIEVLERLAWVERVLKADYELGILRAAPPLPDPDMTFSQFYGRDASNDYSRIQNPELWDMVDEARALSDMAARREIYAAIQQKILDNYWQTYLFWRPQKEVARVELQGFDKDFAGAWRYNNMWLSPNT